MVDKMDKSTIQIITVAAATIFYLILIGSFFLKGMRQNKYHLISIPTYTMALHTLLIIIGTVVSMITKKAWLDYIIPLLIVGLIIVIMCLILSASKFFKDLFGGILYDLLFTPTQGFKILFGFFITADIIAIITMALLIYISVPVVKVKIDPAIQYIKTLVSSTTDSLINGSGAPTAEAATPVSSGGASRTTAATAATTPRPSSTTAKPASTTAKPATTNTPKNTAAPGYADITGDEPINMSLLLHLPTGAEYGDNVAVLVEATPSDTGKMQRILNRRVLTKDFPKQITIQIPPAGSVEVAVYYDGELMLTNVYNYDD